MWKMMWPNIGSFLEGLVRTVKGSRITNFLAGIGTENLPNVSKKIYRYTTKFFER
jgi:hypothetical protein